MIKRLLYVSIHHWTIWCWHRMIRCTAIHVESGYTDLKNVPKQQRNATSSHNWNNENFCGFQKNIWIHRDRICHNKLTAIKLLLTEPRPLSAVLKCSITSQLDFFGVVVVGAWLLETNAFVPDEWNDGTWSSNEICGDRVCRNDVERRPDIPLRCVGSFSCEKHFNEKSDFKQIERKSDFFLPNCSFYLPSESLNRIRNLRRRGNMRLKRSI